MTAKKKKVVEKPEQHALVPVDPLRQFMAQVQRYPMLTQEEERALALSYRDTGDLEAARKLVASHLRLVVKLAMQYRSAYYNLIDLIQEGNVGLLIALKKYDPDKGARFSYYATWWIRSYILKYLLDNFRLIKIGTTKAQRRLFYNLIQEKQRIEAMGFRPDAHLLAGRLGVTVKDIESMSQRLTQPEYSLEAPVSKEPNAGSLGDFIEDESIPRPVDAASKQLLKEQIHNILGALSEREREVLEMRFGLLDGEDHTLEEVGRHFGVTRERIRQIEAKALRKLRHPTRSRALRDYLR